MAPPSNGGGGWLNIKLGGGEGWSTIKIRGYVAVGVVKYQYNGTLVVEGASRYQEGILGRGGGDRRSIRGARSGSWWSTIKMILGGGRGGQLSI